MAACSDAGGAQGYEVGIFHAEAERPIFFDSYRAVRPGVACMAY
jgi:hypothetical protein